MTSTDELPPGFNEEPAAQYQPPAPQPATKSKIDLQSAKRSAKQHDTPLDRLPPHDIQMEMGVLGCQLLDPATVPIVLDKFHHLSIHHYDLRHQTIQDAIFALFRDDQPIELITVQQRLKDNQLLDQIGGIPYLNTLQDAVPSAANLSYYLEVVLKKSTARRLIQTCTLTVGKAYEQDIDDLLLNLESDLSRFKSKSNEGLPDIIDGNQFATSEITEPVVLIEGMLHKGSKLVFGGSSKSHKTWCLLDLALSVSMGADWMGRHTKIGKVLYVNFEIQDFAWQHRINKVAEAKNQAPAPGMFNLWNLRGHSANYKVLIPKIIAKSKKDDYSLIVLDPIYKLYGETDENSAGDVADLLNSVERLASETKAAIAFGAHFAKGNASGKEAIDRISGSGVFARDPDSILVFTKHEEDDAFTVEPILRNFPPVTPFAVRWDFPLMQPDATLDPSKLKSAPGRKQTVQESSILTLLPPDGFTRKEWLEISLENGVSERTFDRLKKHLHSEGKIILSAVSGKYLPVSPKNTHS